VVIPSRLHQGKIMKDKLVQDIMVPLEEYPCVPESHTLRDAIIEMGVQILRKRQATLPRVVLVFDDSHRELLGMLRRRDIMRGLEPSFLVSGSLEYRRKLFEVEIDPNLSELSYEKMIARIRQRAELPVRDFMVPIKATIRFDDHLLKAMYEMVQRNTSLLPVLKEGRVVGVMRSVDVLGELAQIVSS
jgi:CBS domain-containing protein